MEVLTKKRAAIYCRVSTKEQADEGFSIDEQERLLRELCEKEGYDIVDVYSDRGVSAKNISGRPEFKRLLDDVVNNQVDILLAWKLTRISRNLKDVLDIVELLEKYNVQVRFLSEQVDTSTPAGKMQLQLMGMIAEYERETIASNVKLGMRAKALQGGFLGGSVLGYDSVKTVDSNQRTQSKLVINFEEAELVKEIFRLYVEGSGYKAIVTNLNQSGKNYRTKKGGALSVGTVQGVLKNPIYIGKIQFDKYKDYSRNHRRIVNPKMILVDGIHDPIIDMQTWDKVQLLMSLKGGRRENKHNDFTPLTGLLRCPQCGYGMVISRSPSKNGKKIAYYSCGNWKNKGTTVCHCNSIRVDKANKAVLDKVTEFLQNDRMIKGVVDKLNREHEERIAPANKQLNTIERELLKQKKKRDKVFDMYEEELISKEEFTERKDTISQAIEQLEIDKSKYQEDISVGSTEKVSYKLVKDILSKSGEILMGTDNRQEIKTMLHLLISKITINELREIDSIEIQLNENLIKYIKEGDAFDKGASSSFWVNNHLSYLKNLNVRCTIY